MCLPGGGHMPHVAGLIVAFARCVALRGERSWNGGACEKVLGLSPVGTWAEYLRESPCGGRPHPIYPA